MTTLHEAQDHIRQLFGQKDAARGIPGTFMWFMEEVGELSTALREGPADELPREFADVLAWLLTLANCAGIDLETAFREKYGIGCPNCRTQPCSCGPEEKP